MKLQKTSSLIVQGTSYCNLDCSYCYVPKSQRDAYAKLNDDKLIKLIDTLISDELLDDNVIIVWHAGEPLSAGIDFYENAIAKIKSYLKQKKTHHHIAFGFQTNGTLLNDEWCNFIKKEKLFINISLDGPRHLHDENRTYRNKMGTFDHTMRGADLLRKHDIPFSILAVVTSKAMEEPKQFFDFFVDNNFKSFAISPDNSVAANHSVSLASPEGNISYKRFLTELWKLLSEYNNSNEDKITIREFQQIAARLTSETPSDYVDNHPASLIVMSADGDLFTCYPELINMSAGKYGDRFSFGNIETLSSVREAIINSSLIKSMYDDIKKGYQKCLNECEYYPVCGNARSVNKFNVFGTFNASETPDCIAEVKSLVDVVLEDYTYAN
jgi:uncharacterized protein